MMRITPRHLAGLLSISILVLTTSLSGCADSIEPGTTDPGTGDPGTGDPGTGDPGTGDPGTGDPGTGDLVVLDSAEGDAGTLIIDATDKTEDAWTALDLDGSAPASWAKAIAVDAGGWDIAFQRANVALGEGAKLAVVDGVAFDALTDAPAEGWLTDGEPETAMAQLGDWYDYDPGTHLLTPKADRVFVVLTSAGQARKIAWDGYYDAFGTSAVVTVQVGTVNAPVLDPGGPDLPAGAIEVDTSAGWTFVGFGPHGPVSDMAEGDAWWLALEGTKFQTQSGPVADAWGGAKWAPEGAAFDTILDAETTGFEADAELPLPGPPGSGTFDGNPVLNAWYDYDVTTHSVTPKDRAFIVRGPDGDLGKLQIWSYGSSTYQLSFEPIERVVATHEDTVDASDGEAWTFVSLRHGTAWTSADLPDGADPEGADAHGWDLALSRTAIRTNSGTSGPGMGGAMALPETAFDAITELPVDAEFTADTMVPLPGPPGSGEASGNAVLDTWYDYDFMTHTVSPADVSFALQLADGSHAKLRVTGWDDGVFTLQWASAGAGFTTF